MSEENPTSSRKSPSRVSKGGRSIYCCIPGCGSSFYDNKGNKTKIGFFKFPKDKAKKQKWVRAVNCVRRKGAGDNFEITNYTRICEFHFKKEDVNVSYGLSGRKTPKSDAVPIFKKSEPKPTRRSPRKRTLETIVESDINVAEDIEEPESELDILQREIADLKAENVYLKNQVDKLENKIQDFKNRTYNYENISKNEKYFKSETGLELDCFKMLYDFLNPGDQCENVKIYESKQKSEQNDEADVMQSPTTSKAYSYKEKPGPTAKLNARDQLFLYMTWLKGGFSLNHASWLFDLPKSTVSRYIITWSNFMYFSLASLPIWPSKEVVNETMPVTFQNTYPTTRCIIDCTELFCQRPSSMSIQSHMYSQYKSHVTYKGLVGISPAGAVTFVSQLYEGCISDNEIVKRSGFLEKDLWSNGDSVMADRGFTIEEDLKPLNVKLNIPAFLDQRQQFSEAEVKESQTIASVRIHVERAIQRVKKFKQIRNEIPLTLHGSINQIWTVSCLVCNFMSPLIQKDLPVPNIQG